MKLVLRLLILLVPLLTLVWAHSHYAQALQRRDQLGINLGQARIDVQQVVDAGISVTPPLNDTQNGVIVNAFHQAISESGINMQSLQELSTMIDTARDDGPTRVRVTKLFIADIQPVQLGQLLLAIEQNMPMSAVSQVLITRSSSSTGDRKNIYDCRIEIDNKVYETKR